VLNTDTDTRRQVISYRKNNSHWIHDTIRYVVATCKAVCVHHQRPSWEGARRAAKARSQ